MAAQAAAAAASTTPSISPSGHPSRTAYTPSVTSSVPSLMLDTREVVLMRANMEEVPYTFLRAGGDGGGGAMGVGGDGNTISNKIPVGFVWAFGPCYSPLQPLLLQAGTLLEIHRRPREQRNAALEVRCSNRDLRKKEKRPPIPRRSHVTRITTSPVSHSNVLHLPLLNFLA